MQKARLARNIFITAMLLTALVGYDIAHDQKTVVLAKTQEATATPKPMWGETHITSVTFPTPTPKPVTTEDKIRAVFKDQADTAFRILECENKGLNPKAVNVNKNGTWDAGIFQINQIHGYPKEHLFNVDNNIQAAYKIYKSSGWNAWSCYRKVKGVR